MTITNRILSTSLAAAIALAIVGCGEDREPNIIYSNLPLKTTELYMVGDAAPCGWSMDNRTPLEADPENIYRFTYDGRLNPGELKFSLLNESWNDPFIRPDVPGMKVTEEGVKNREFLYWAGSPDDKWNIVSPGTYHIELDLKAWTYSIEYISAPYVAPYVARTVYPIGDSVEGIGWDLGKARSLAQKSTYEWEGELKLKKGELKFLTELDWHCTQVRPYKYDMPWTAEGIDNQLATDDDTQGDRKWKVSDPGRYHVTINLENWRVNAVYLGE